MPRPTRQATPDANAKSQSKQARGVLNRADCTPSVEDVSTPGISNRARRRTQKEVHGSVRTRPTSERLQNSEKTLARTPLGVLASPFKVPRRVQERGGKHLSDEDRVAFAKLAHLSTKLGVMSMAELCRRWGMTTTHGYRVLARYRQEESVAVRPRSGRPRVLDDEDMSTLERIADTTGGYVTWEGFAEKFNEETGKNVCAKTVYNSCKEAGWRTVCERFVPCLSANDVERRLKWAREHLNYSWIGAENCPYKHLKKGMRVGWVDIDEKWFEMRTRRMLKMPKDKKRPRCAVQSRKYVKKVMGLSAVGRPCGNFDGRIGMYRVARDKIALRKSKNHNRGDVYKEDCEMDGDLFHEIVTEKLLPDIHEKMIDFDVVYVQLDGARPHVSRWQHLQHAGAERRQIKGQKAPHVKFVLQPANSPDTNLNDLCFFRSLAREVQGHEREFKHDYRGLEEFWACLEKTFHRYHTRDTLERCWDVKTAVNTCILEANGTNDYMLPHGFRDIPRISAPLSCDSDYDEDPVARVLEYEGLHPSLPSSLPR